MRKYSVLSGFMVFCIAALFMFNGCSGSESEVKPKFPKASYNYILTDSAGTTLVSGVLTVATVTKVKVGDTKNNYDFTGTYTIENMTTDTSYYGFSTMTGGQLKGMYNDGEKSVWINTNPMIADANVFLTGKVISGNWDGNWNYSTFRGSRQEAGYFKATKK